MNLDSLSSKLQQLPLEQSNYQIIPRRLLTYSLSLLLVRNNQEKVIEYTINTVNRVSQFKIHTSPTVNEIKFFINTLDQLTFKDIPDHDLMREDLDKLHDFTSEKIYYPAQLVRYLKVSVIYYRIYMVSNFESAFNSYAKEIGLVPKSWGFRMTSESNFVITNSEGSIVLEVMTSSVFNNKGICVELRVQSTGRSVKAVNSLRKFLEALPSKSLENCNLTYNPNLKAIFLKIQMTGNTPLIDSLAPLLSAIYHYADRVQVTEGINLNF